MSIRRAMILLLAPAAFLACAAGRGHTTRIPTSEQTPLDRYIAKPDAEYGWKLMDTNKGEGQTTYFLELTSQRWRSEQEVDRPVWKHWLTIVKPDGAENDRRHTGFLFIGGGDNTDPRPEKAPDRVRDLALGTKTVVAELYHVPNQPLFFRDTPEKGRVEDDLIAYSRVKYMNTGDEEWPVRLAMVKSAVRAMDAVQEFMASPQWGGLKVKKFVVAGGSKRGWTTWLTGVQDSRVIAIIPIVIDALNSQMITRHHYEAYGFFSKALEDYVKAGIFPHRIGTPEYARALAIEDPMNYFGRESLSIPKFCVNSAQDEFFLPDNSRFYWDEMPGEKRLRYVPNAKHSLAGSDARESVEAFYQAILDGTPRPEYSWEKRPDGSLLVKTKQKPREVRLWQVANPGARDFRLDSVGKSYVSAPLEPQPDGTYLGQIPKPDRGYAAFFVELTYDSGGRFPFKFTTEVSVVPDTLPYRFEDALKLREIPLK